MNLSNCAKISGDTLGFVIASRKKLKGVRSAPIDFKSQSSLHVFFLNVKCKFLTVRCEVNHWVRWKDETDGHILILDRLTELWSVQHTF